jgi:phosphoribosylformimino-5-aminoimidazole carboxamide ribotide isomerase
MADLGVRTLTLANVSGDGAPDAQQFSALEQARTALPETTLIAAGGFATLADLRRLAGMGMDGVVLGRPLYHGVLPLAEALRVAGEDAPIPDATSPDAP